MFVQFEISDINEIYLQFSQPMSFPLEPLSEISYNITGPLAPYHPIIISAIINHNMLLINMTELGAFGRKKENITFTFGENLKSIKGTSIVNKTISTHAYKVTIVPSAVVVTGKAVAISIGICIFLVVSTNVALGSSSEVFWGMIYSLQYLYAFRFLALNYPD